MRMTEKESEAEMRSRCLARRCDTSILLHPPHPSSPTPVPTSSLSNAQSTPKKKKQKGQVREIEITELECWQIQSGQRRTGNGTDRKLHTQPTNYYLQAAQHEQFLKSLNEKYNNKIF